MKPAYTLHKLSEGFIITSDERPNGSDLIMWAGDAVEHFPKQGTSNIKYGCVVESVNYLGTAHKNWKKVIAQQDQIDFSSLSEEEQKKIGYFDTEKFLKDEIDYWYNKTGSLTSEEIIRRTFSMSLKAQELLSDRAFTLEDLINNFKPVFDKFINEGGTNGNSEDWVQWQNVVDWFPKFLQSLSQLKSWPVELEMEGEIPKFTNSRVKILNVFKH
jgi:hypothetical protein